MPVIGRRIIIGLLGFWAAVVAAQLTAQAATPAAAPATGPVDTSALAYYASKHDSVRVDAELRRLRTLYPNWQPPADPMALTVAPSGESDDKPLWDLFAADKLDELDAAIADHKAADPAWNPPDDLVTKLAVKRARLDLIAASDRKDFAAVVAIAAKNPELSSPDDLDVSWRLAEAYGRTGASDKAFKIDKAILDTAQDPVERLATVRKAMVSLAPADLEKLVMMGKPAQDGRSEFDAVDLDLVRLRVSHMLSGPASDSATPQDIAHLEAAAARPGDANDAALLGWLYSRQQDWTKANLWFQAALKAGPDPVQAKPEDAKVAQGAVYALKAAGHAADAEKLAYQWRDADPTLALFYVDSVATDLTKPKPVALDPERLKQFGAVVTSLQSGAGAQGLGWYAYNIGQFKPALAWFQKSMAWQPRDTTALGLALSLRQIGDKGALAAFIQENAPTFPSLTALSDARTKIKASTAPQPRPPGRAPAVSVDQDQPDASAATIAPRPRNAPRRRATGCTAAPRYGDATSALQAGWCLLELKRAKEAAVAFATARQGDGTRVDAAFGEALADLRSNRTDEALAVASSANLTETRRNDIGLAAMAQAAATAFDEGRYKDTLRALNKRRLFEAEPRDLAMLRAWSTYHIGHVEEARNMFTSLDGQLSTGETRAGIAATAQQSRQ